MRPRGKCWWQPTVIRCVATAPCRGRRKPTHARAPRAAGLLLLQVRLFSVADFSCQLLAGHKDIVLAVDVSPDGRWAATASKDNTARVWEVATARCVAVCEGHTASVAAVALPRKVQAYPGGVAAVMGAALVATAGEDRTLKLWELGRLWGARRAARTCCGGCA